MDKVDFLIKYLLKEKGIEKDLSQLNENEKINLFRSLCNVRMPQKASEEFYKIQDEYLTDVNQKKGIVSITDEYRIADKLYLWQGDITRLNVDAIVNAANSQGLGCFQPLHNCIDNQIHTFAGISLREECAEIMKKIEVLETGKTFITNGYNLPCKYVIHTVGPIINFKASEKQKDELKNCYINSLKIAEEKGLKSIAFPCISTGVFNFPNDLACEIAVNAVKEYFSKADSKIEKVVFNVYLDKDYKLYREVI